MSFAAYLLGAALCFSAAILTPNQGQALGLTLLAVLTLIAAAVQGGLLK